MELKLSVNIGATLQVKNARGEWDWIKPEVGAEISMNNDEIDKLPMGLQQYFDKMWNEVVGPQFQSVVVELIAEQSAPKAERDPDSEAPPVTDDDEY